MRTLPLRPGAALLLAAFLLPGLLLSGLILPATATATAALEVAANGASNGASSGAEATPATALQPAPPPPAEQRELWTGSLYSSTYRAGVCLGADGNVRGVLLLRQSSGKVDVYHFYGAHKDGVINAHHPSGHVFKGGFDDADTVRGKITLKNGFNVTLKGRRTHDAPLSETCRPLD